MNNPDMEFNWSQKVDYQPKNKIMLDNKYVKSFLHSLAIVVAFGIPIVIGSHAPWLDLTIGGVLTWIYAHVVML